MIHRIASFALFAMLGMELLSCSASTAPTNSTDILPLTVGNEWHYQRLRYERGEIRGVDTLNVTVIRSMFAAGKTAYEITQQTPYDARTLIVARESATSILVLDTTDSTWSPMIDLSKNTPTASFLWTVIAPMTYSHYYFPLADTTVSDAGGTATAKRMHEHDDLLDPNGNVGLRLDFQHYFVPGIGQTRAAYILDLTQCAECSLFNAFWTDSLISYTLK